MYKGIISAIKTGIIVNLILITPNVIGQPISAAYRPYFGVNAKMNHFSWENDFGSNLFKRDVPQAEFFIGAQLAENFGFDIGYQTSASKRKFVTLGAKDVFLGLPVSNISDPPISFLSFIQTKGVYTNINLILPLKKYFSSIGLSNIDLLGQIGLVRLQVTHKVHTIRDVVDNYDILTFSRYFKNQKIIPRLGLGLQYHPGGQTWGLRFMANWDHTKRFSKLPANKLRGTINMKNSYNYGIGIFCKI